MKRKLHTYLVHLIDGERVKVKAHEIRGLTYGEGTPRPALFLAFFKDYGKHGVKEVMRFNDVQWTYWKLIK